MALTELEQLQVQVGSLLSRGPDKVNRYLFHWGLRRSPKMLSVDDGNQAVRSLIVSGQPALVGRMGRTEQAVMRRALLLGVQSHPERVRWIGRSLRRNLRILSGVFPETDQSILDFSLEYVAALEAVDIMTLWRNLGDGLMLSVATNAKALIPLRALQPFFVDDRWTNELAGRDVAIVHPFVDTLRGQAQKLSEIWPDGRVPDAKYSFIAPPQTIAGDSELSSWLAELEIAKERVANTPAEVVLVAAGAYGLPLAATAKAAGKVAVLVGGALQIFFGVRGVRWDQWPDYRKLYNGAWTRPGLDETPRGAGDVEGGCYW